MSEQDRRGSYRLDVSIVPSETVVAVGRFRQSLAGVIHNVSVDGARLSLLGSDLRRG